MSDAKTYDHIVKGWLDSALLDGKRTAYISPDTLLAAPQGSLRGLIDLIKDGHRIVIGRKKGTPENG